MLQDNLSEMAKPPPILLNASNSSDSDNKKTNDTKLINFNSNTPLLTLIQNKLVSEISTKHFLISQVSVPPHFVFSILNHLIDLHKSAKFNFLNEKLFSSFTLPNYPSSIFFEGPTKEEILQLFSIFNNTFSITENNIIQFTNPSDIIQNVCNPLRTIAFQIGSLIRISTPSFLNQIVQVIDFIPEKAKVYIKFCPRIDYELLKQKGVNSQAQLNNLMPSDYLPPIDKFQPEKLEYFIPSVEIIQKEIKLSWNDEPVICSFWDNSLFIGPLQCKKMKISHLSILPLDLKNSEVELFQQGLTEFEKKNETFIRNFQMSYDSSFETIVQDFNILDSSFESKLESFQDSIDTSNTKSQNTNRNNDQHTSISSPSSMIDNELKNLKVHQDSFSNDANIRPNNSSGSLIKSHNEAQTKHYNKNPNEIIKVGDIVICTKPIEKLMMKVREIDKKIIKADLLNVPISGAIYQFQKAPPNSLLNLEKSVYEIAKEKSTEENSFPIEETDDQIPQSNIKQELIKDNFVKKIKLLRFSDLIITFDGKIYVTLDTNDDENTVVVMDLYNKTTSIDLSEVAEIIQTDGTSVDSKGRKIYLNNIVIIDEKIKGKVTSIYNNKVLVEFEDQNLHFYDGSSLSLDPNCLYANYQNNNNNYDSGYNNNNNNIGTNNNYNNNSYNKGYNTKNSNYYDSSYSNSRNYYESDYTNGSNSKYRYNDNNNDRISPGPSRYNQRSGYDDDYHNSYDNFSRNSRSNTPSQSPPPPNSFKPPQSPPPARQQPKSTDTKLRFEKNFIVKVPDNNKDDAVIVDIRNDKALVQFYDREKKKVRFKQHEYLLKDLKYKSFHIGDIVISYFHDDHNRERSIIGKVKRIRDNSVYIEEDKKKKDKNYSSRHLESYRLSNTYRYYDWDNLMD